MKVFILAALHFHAVFLNLNGQVGAARSDTAALNKYKTSTSSRSRIPVKDGYRDTQISEQTAGYNLLASSYKSPRTNIPYTNCTKL